MKKLLLYFSIICLVFASCKKDKNDTNSSDYYMSAKVDGVQKTYKNKTIAVRVQADTIYSIGLNAYGE